MHWRDIPRPAYIGDNIMTAEYWAREASLAERIAAVARSQERAKVKEIRENDGPQVRLYLKVAGVFSPSPWCAAFLDWCAEQAGADPRKLAKFPASTFFLWDWAKKNDLLRDPATGMKKGDWFVWNNTGGGHCGVVMSKLENGSFSTIEGNTNDKGSREGVMVMQKLRSLAALKGNKRWAIIRIPDSLGVGE